MGNRGIMSDAPLSKFRKSQEQYRGSLSPICLFETFPLFRATQAMVVAKSLEGTVGYKTPLSCFMRLRAEIGITQARAVRQIASPLHQMLRGSNR